MAIGMGLGYILGGALQGAGAGIAAQATADAEQRRQIALQELRQKNAVDLDAVQTDNAIKRDGVQHGQALERDLKQTENADWADARGTVRKTSSSITVDNNRLKNETVLKKLDFEQDKVLKSIDFSNDVQIARVKSALDNASEKDRLAYAEGLKSGDVVDTVEGGDGKIYGLRKDGTKIDLGIAAKQDDASGGSALSRARERNGGGSGAAPKTAPKAKPDAQKGKWRNGFPVAANDAEAEAIMSNPKNAGKKFYGYDGQMYQVPK